jgi:hypothetical protein
MIRTQSPENIRIENRKENNRREWSKSTWYKVRDQFLLKNPVCIHCGRHAQTAHPKEDRTYGTPEYLDLSDAEPICNSCHYALFRRGLKLCKECQLHYHAPSEEHCRHCRTPEELSIDEQRKASNMYFIRQIRNRENAKFREVYRELKDVRV